MRRRPRDDQELAERIHADKTSDRIADRFDNRYTDTHIRRIEEQRAPWLKERRRK